MGQKTDNFMKDFEAVCELSFKIHADLEIKIIAVSNQTVNTAIQEKERNRLETELNKLQPNSPGRGEVSGKLIQAQTELEVQIQRLQLRKNERDQKKTELKSLTLRFKELKTKFSEYTTKKETSKTETFKTKKSLTTAKDLISKSAQLIALNEKLYA